MSRETLSTLDLALVNAAASDSRPQPGREPVQLPQGRASAVSICRAGR